MDSVWERFGGVILVTLLIGAPLGAAALFALRRHRLARGWTPGWAWRSAAADVGLVLGTAPWIWMTMTPTGQVGGLQLVPFRDLADVLSGGDTTVQVVGNLFVFAALGFFLPIRLRLARPAAVVAVVALIAGLLSAVLEALQLVLGLGRVTSVDDVLVNALGAALASLLSVRWWRSRRAGTPAGLAS
jgi:VanZ family protein